MVSIDVERNNRYAKRTLYKSDMDISDAINSGIEHLTFGLRIHYLLKIIILQFGTLFLSLQFKSQLTIVFIDETAFSIVYFLISLILLVIIWILVRDMCLRTFSPKMRSWWHISFSLLLYNGFSVLAVTIGFISLIAVSDGVSGLGQPDLIAGIFFSTVFSALLAVGYHDQLESLDHPTRAEIKKAISKWRQYQSWVELEEGSQAKKEEQESFEDACDNLSTLLQSANSQQGRQLQTDFDSWLDKYRQHEPVAREIIIKGQDKEELKNEALEKEHQLFLSLCDTMEKISPDNK